MGLVFKDRVKQTSTTNGTSNVVMTGTIGGFQTFANALADADTTYYCIVDDTNDDFEVGLGTWAEGSATLTRTTILESSNSNNAVNFSGSVAKEVFITYPAEKAVFLNANDKLVVGGVEYLSATTNRWYKKLGFLQTMASALGNDDNGNALSFSGDQVDVFVNGVRLSKDAGDYTLGTNQVDFASNMYPSQDDIVEIVSYNVFSGTYADSDVDTHLNRSTASSGEVLSWNGSDYDWVATGAGNLSNVIEDTSPQLGGNLDINGNDIVSTSNANIEILPNGTGKVHLDGDGSTGGILASDGLLEIKTGSGSVAEMRFYCESSNAHYVALKSPAHSSYSGNVTLTLPSTDGSSGEYLKTDGSGILSWDSPSGSSDLVNDTSPELGGNLDVLTRDIVSSSNRDIDVKPNGSGKIKLVTTTGTTIVTTNSGGTNTTLENMNLWLNNDSTSIGSSVALALHTGTDTSSSNAYTFMRATRESNTSANFEINVQHANSGTPSYYKTTFGANTDGGKVSFPKTIEIGNADTYQSLIQSNGSISADRTFTLPDASGTIALTSDISGGGNTDILTFETTSSLPSSVAQDTVKLYEHASALYMRSYRGNTAHPVFGIINSAGTEVFKVFGNGDLTLTDKITAKKILCEGGSDTGRIELQAPNVSDHISINAPATLSGSTDYILPEDGSSGDFLQTNGSGTLSWASAGGSRELVYSSTLNNVSEAEYDLGGSFGYLWEIFLALQHAGSGSNAKIRYANSNQSYNAFNTTYGNHYVNYNSTSWNNDTGQVTDPPIVSPNLVSVSSNILSPLFSHLLFYQGRKGMSGSTYRRGQLIGRSSINNDPNTHLTNHMPQSTNQIRFIKFMANSGNISGNIRVFRIKLGL